MRLAIKPFCALLVATLALVPLTAHAGQFYDGEAFAQAQADGKSILVDISAPWCPTCAKQKPIIQGIEQATPDLVVFDVDFDTDKDILKQLRVQYQSTLIVFKGMTEVGRSTGETDPEAIRALVNKALSDHGQ